MDMTNPRPEASTAPKVGDLLGSTVAKALAAPMRSDADVSADLETQESRRRQLAVDKLAAQAGGVRMAGHRFKTWEASGSAQNVVKQAVRDWADTFTERMAACEGLILYGPCGTGKDHLVFAAVRQAILAHGCVAAWVNGRDLAGEIRDRITLEQTEGRLIRQYEIPDVLVISDPLPTMGSLREHQADMLYRVVENRYANARLTCMTLNVNDDSEAIEAMGMATWDRVCHGAWKCFCNWPSYRKPAREIGK